MGRRHFKPEQIIHAPREAEIKLAGGKTTVAVRSELGTSEQSYYRRLKEYGGMQVSQAKKLMDLERENARSTGNKSAPDFVIDRSYDGRPFRMLTVIDEYSRECLAIRTERKQSQETLLETLADPVVLNGPSVISAPIIAPSLQRRGFLNGRIDSTCKPCPVSRAAKGRTPTTKALTASSARRVWTAGLSNPWLRPESLPASGWTNTTPSGRMAL